MLQEEITGLYCYAFKTYFVAKFKFEVFCIRSDQYEYHYTVGSSKSDIRLAETWKNREMHRNRKVRV